MSDFDGQVLSLVMLEGPLKSNCLLSIVFSSVAVTKYTLIGLELNSLNIETWNYIHTCMNVLKIAEYNSEIKS